MIRFAAALISFLVFFGLIAPALLERGGQMRQRMQGTELGIGGWFGTVRVAVRIEWRMQL